MSCFPNLIKCGVDAVGGVAGSVAGDVFDQVAQSFAHFAEHATTFVWKELDLATALKLQGARWDGVLQVTVEIGVLVCVAMFLLQVILSALRGSVGGMGRAVRGVMIAMVGTFASFVIMDTLLTVVDSLSTGVMQALAGTSTWTELGSKVVNAQTLTGGALGSAAMLLCALVMLGSTLVVWGAWMIRKRLLIVGAAVAPLAFGGSPFEPTSAWVRRWIEFTLAMIFSKLILVLLFCIGLQIELGLGQAGTGTFQQITQMMTGLMVLTVAGFAPWSALKLVHWTGGSFQQAHQHAQASSAAAQSAIEAPQRLHAGARAGLGGLALAASKLPTGPRGSDAASNGSGGGGDGATGSASPGGGGGGSAGGSGGSGGGAGSSRPGGPAGGASGGSGAGGGGAGSSRPGGPAGGGSGGSGAGGGGAGSSRPGGPAGGGSGGGTGSASTGGGGGTPAAAPGPVASSGVGEPASPGGGWFAGGGGGGEPASSVGGKPGGPSGPAGPSGPGGGGGLAGGVAIAGA